MFRCERTGWKRESSQHCISAWRVQPEADTRSFRFVGDWHVESRSSGKLSSLYIDSRCGLTVPLLLYRCGFRIDERKSRENEVPFSTRLLPLKFRHPRSTLPLPQPLQYQRHNLITLGRRASRQVNISGGSPTLIQLITLRNGTRCDTRLRKHISRRPLRVYLTTARCLATNESSSLAQAHLSLRQKSSRVHRTLHLRTLPTSLLLHSRTRQRLLVQHHPTLDTSLETTLDLIPLRLSSPSLRPRPLSTASPSALPVLNTSNENPSSSPQLKCPLRILLRLKNTSTLLLSEDGIHLQPRNLYPPSLDLVGDPSRTQNINLSVPLLPPPPSRRLLEELGDLTFAFLRLETFSTLSTLLLALPPSHRHLPSLHLRRVPPLRLPSLTPRILPPNRISPTRLYLILTVVPISSLVTLSTLFNRRPPRIDPASEGSGVTKVKWQGWEFLQQSVKEFLNALPLPVYSRCSPLHRVPFHSLSLVHALLFALAFYVEDSQKFTVDSVTVVTFPSLSLSTSL